jgi:hypothetical protein
MRHRNAAGFALEAMRLSPVTLRRRRARVAHRIVAVDALGAGRRLIHAPLCAQPAAHTSVLY